ncbi:methyl-accepting chemotaxis protein [Caenimonas terrae]|uniref:Methyl-accepting chemotaxis protein n=1 Tax=Caenimonas terrae TaxID=696074 RepID=A0ABW0NAW6_9BURK
MQAASALRASDVAHRPSDRSGPAIDGPAGVDDAAPSSVGLFRRSTIRVRLIVAFCFVAVLLMVLAGVGSWEIDSLNRAAEYSMRGQRLMGKWFAETQGNVIRTMVMSRTDDAGVREQLAPEMAAASQRITALQKEVESLLTTASSKALFEQVGARRKAYLEIRQRMLEKKKAGQGQEALAMLDNALVPAMNSYLGSIEALLDFYGGAAGGESAAGRARAQTAQMLVIGVCLLAIVVGFVFAWKITSGIVGPVRFAAKLARRVAGGDLTATVRTGGSDEIAQMLQALSDMMADLRTVVGEVSVGARTVTDSSTRLAAGHLDLSQRTEEQAATLEQTASSMEELTVTVNRNAENARHASQLAAGASEVARQGGAVVGDVVATMTEISESSRKIADIIGVIDGIAFQTNILALNAAVEAARAGEQGRGFAVVAAEVRSLAQRSAAAAGEIKALIGASAGKVEAGTRLVDAAGATMAQIVASVREVTDLVAQIAAASHEQSAGIQQVNTAVARMEQAVQQNAALVDEATAATEAMKGEASALLRSVGRFRLADAPAQAAPAQAGPAAGRSPGAIRVQQAAGTDAALHRLHSLALAATGKYAGQPGRKDS